MVIVAYIFDRVARIIASISFMLGNLLSAVGIKQTEHVTKALAISQFVCIIYKTVYYFSIQNNFTAAYKHSECKFNVTNEICIQRAR